MKVAIVVGHHKWSKGAKSPYLLSEWDLNKEIAESLKDVADVFYHNPNIRGYNARQIAMSKRTKDYDYVLELHYNAASPSANGCEALYWYSNVEGKYLAAKFCDMVFERMGIKDRGAKAMINNSQRGFGFMYYTKKTALILEPFFGTNFEDVSKFDKCMYIDLLRQFIKEL